MFCIISKYVTKTIVAHFIILALLQYVSCKQSSCFFHGKTCWLWLYWLYSHVCLYVYFYVNSIFLLSTFISVGQGSPVNKVIGNCKLLLPTDNILRCLFKSVVRAAADLLTPFLFPSLLQCTVVQLSNNVENCSFGIKTKLKTNQGTTRQRWRQKQRRRQR